MPPAKFRWFTNQPIFVAPPPATDTFLGDGYYLTTDRPMPAPHGNHKTINSLTQAGGPAGSRRRVWVGTTGGVFLGKQSLDLE